MINYNNEGFDDNYYDSSSANKMIPLYQTPQHMPSNKLNAYSLQPHYQQTNDISISAAATTNSMV